MAIAIKKSSTPVKEEVESSLSPEIQNQISNNLKLDETDYTAITEHTNEEGLKQSVTSVTAQRNKRTEDLVQLKFSKGKRAEAKAFFSACDVKMNAGFEMAYEFLKQEVQSGRVKLSKSGIQRIN